MITKVSFRSFKSLREVDIDFTSRLTVLVGPNASGKTSVLQGISLTSQVMSTKGHQWGISSDLLCKLMRADKKISIRVNQKDEYVDDAVIAVHSEYIRDIRRGYVGTNIMLCLDEADKDDHSLDAPSLGFEEPVYRFDPRALAKAAVPGVRRMDAEGRGLASSLADIATSDPARLAMIVDALRRVIPIVKQVRLLPIDLPVAVNTNDPTGAPVSESRTMRGYRLAFDLRGAERVPVEQVSEGTLLVLGWLTAVMAYEGRWLFLLDDIDRGLHPKAQRELLEILRRLLDQNPHYQIIATTHSPYLLDLLKPEEVRIMTAAEDGATLCGTLMEHPEFARWKDLMLPGEMWSTVGEEWLREQRAKRNDLAQ